MTEKKQQPQQQDTPFAINNKNAADAEPFLDQKLDLITAGAKPFLK